MPTIRLSPEGLQQLQKLLDGLDIPDAPAPEDTSLSHPEWRDEYALQRATDKIAEACPVCGDTDCDRGVAGTGQVARHAKSHPTGHRGTKTHG